MKVKLSINHHSTSLANLYAARICLMFYYCNGFYGVVRAILIGSIVSFACCEVVAVWIRL